VEAPRTEETFSTSRYFFQERGLTSPLGEGDERRAGGGAKKRSCNSPYDVIYAVWGVHKYRLRIEK